MSESVLHVGAKIDDQAATNIATLIERTFRVGHETHMDQETVREALGLIQKVATPNVSITGSNFRGDVNMYPDGPND